MTSVLEERRRRRGELLEQDLIILGVVERVLAREHHERRRRFGRETVHAADAIREDRRVQRVFTQRLQHAEEDLPLLGVVFEPDLVLTDDLGEDLRDIREADRSTICSRVTVLVERDRRRVELPEHRDPPITEHAEPIAAADLIEEPIRERVIERRRHIGGPILSDQEGVGERDVSGDRIEHDEGILPRVPGPDAGDVVEVQIRLLIDLSHDRREQLLSTDRSRRELGRELLDARVAVCVDERRRLHREQQRRGRLELVPVRIEHVFGHEREVICRELEVIRVLDDDLIRGVIRRLDVTNSHVHDLLGLAIGAELPELDGLGGHRRRIDRTTERHLDRDRPRGVGPTMELVEVLFEVDLRVLRDLLVCTERRTVRGQALERGRGERGQTISACVERERVGQRDRRRG